MVGLNEIACRTVSDFRNSRKSYISAIFGSLVGWFIAQDSGWYDFLTDFSSLFLFISVFTGMWMLFYLIKNFWRGSKTE